MNRLTTLVLIVAIGAAQCFFDNSYIYPYPQRSLWDPFNSYHVISSENRDYDSPQDDWDETRDATNVLATSGMGRPSVYTAENFPVPEDGDVESEPSPWPMTYTEKPVPNALLDTFHYIASKMYLENTGSFIDFSRDFYRTNCDTYDWRPRQFFQQLLTRSGFHFHMPYLSMYLSDVLAYHNSLLAKLNQKIDDLEGSNNRKLKHLENEFQVKLEESSQKFNRAVKKIRKTIVKHAKKKSSLDTFIETMLKLKKSFKTEEKPKNIVFAPNFVDFRNDMNHYEINKDIRIVETGCAQPCASETKCCRVRTTKRPNFGTTMKTSPSPDFNENREAPEEDEFNKTKKPDVIEDATKVPDTHKTVAPSNPDVEKNDEAPDEGDYNKPKKPQATEESTKSPSTIKTEATPNPDAEKDNKTQKPEIIEVSTKAPESHKTDVPAKPGVEKNEEAPDEDEYNQTKKPPVIVASTTVATVVSHASKQPDTEKEEEAPEEDGFDRTKKPHITSSTTESPKVTKPYAKEETEENNDEDENNRTKKPSTRPYSEATETNTEASKDPETDKSDENPDENGFDATKSPKSPENDNLPTATPSSEHISTPKSEPPEVIEKPTKPEYEDGSNETKHPPNFEASTRTSTTIPMTEQQTSNVNTEASHRPEEDKTEEAPDEGEYSRTKKPQTTELPINTPEVTKHPEQQIIVTPTVPDVSSIRTPESSVVPSTTEATKIVTETASAGPSSNTYSSSEAIVVTVQPQIIEDTSISGPKAPDNFQVVTPGVITGNEATSSNQLLPEIVDEVTALPGPIATIPAIEVNDKITIPVESVTVTIKPISIEPLPIVSTEPTEKKPKTPTNEAGDNPEDDETKSEAHLIKDVKTPSPLKPEAPEVTSSTIKPLSPPFSGNEITVPTPLIPNEEDSGFNPSGGVKWTTRPPTTADSPLFPDASDSGYKPSGGVKWTTRLPNAAYSPIAPSESDSWPPNGGGVWNYPGGHKVPDEFSGNSNSESSWQSWGNWKPGQGKPSESGSWKHPYKPGNSWGTWNNRRPGQEASNQESHWNVPGVHDSTEWSNGWQNMIPGNFGDGMHKLGPVDIDGTNYYELTCIKSGKQQKFWIKQDKQHEITDKACTDQISYPRVIDEDSIAKLEQFKLKIIGGGTYTNRVVRNGRAYYLVTCNIKNKQQRFWISYDVGKNLPEGVCSNLDAYSQITDLSEIEKLDHSMSEGFGGSMKASGIMMDGHTYYLVTCEGYGKSQDDSFWIQYDARKKLTYDVCTNPVTFPRVTDQAIINKLTLLKNEGSGGSMKASGIVMDGHTYYLVTCGNAIKKISFWVQYDSKEKLKYDVCTDQVNFPRITDQNFLAKLEEMRIRVFGGVIGSGISMNGHTYYQVSCNINHKQQTFWIKFDSEGGLPEDVCSNIGEYSRITDTTIIDQLSDSKTEGSGGSMKASGVMMDGHSYFLVTCKGYGKLKEDSFWIQYDAREKLTFDVCFNSDKFPRINDQTLIDRLILLKSGGSGGSMKASGIVMDGHTYYLVTCTNSFKKVSFWVQYDSKEKLKYDVCTDQVNFPRITDQNFLAKLEEMRIRVFGGVIGSGISMNGHTYYQVSCNINHKQQTFWIKFDSEGGLPEDVCSNIGDYSRITDTTIIDQLSGSKTEGSGGSMKASGVMMDGHSYYLVTCKGYGKLHEDAFWIQYDAREKLTYDVCFNSDKFPRINDQTLIGKLTLLKSGGSRGGMKASGIVMDGHAYYLVNCTFLGKSETFWIQHDSKGKLSFDVCTDAESYPRITDEAFVQKLTKRIRHGSGGGMEASGISVDGHAYYFIKCTMDGDTKTFWIQYDSKEKLPYSVCEDEVKYPRIADGEFLSKLEQLRTKMLVREQRVHRTAMNGHVYYEVTCGSGSERKKVWINYDLPGDLPGDLCTNSATHSIVVDQVTIDSLNELRVKFVGAGMKARGIQKGSHTYYEVTCGTDEPFWTMYDLNEKLSFDVCTDSKTYPRITDQDLIQSFSNVGKYSQKVTSDCMAFKTGVEEKIYCNVTCTRGTYSEVFFINVADTSDQEHFCDRRKYPAIEDIRLLAKLTLAFSRATKKGHSAFEQSCLTLGPDFYCKIKCSTSGEPMYIKPETRDISAEEVCTDSQKFNQVTFGDLPKAVQRHWSS